MARPRKQTYPMETYLINNKEGDISNNADTQRKPAWKTIINGLIVTILTDDYIPPIILAEEENTQLNIVDGGSRTAAFMMYRYGNHRISSSVEDSIISYKKKVKENGKIIWEDATFDIKGKTYDQLPEELKKKFNGYQIETVIHEHCDKNKIATYIKRYNEHSSMNTNQKAFTYIDKFANQIRKIMDSDFFLNCNDYTDNDKEKGVIERIIVETIMCINHFDGWSREAKKLFKYINDYGTKKEFDILEEYIYRLGNIVTEDVKDIFNKRDSFIFLTLFDRFTKFEVEDIRFADFLREFKNNLRQTRTNDNGLLFDEIKRNNSTKDKTVIADKLDMLETLLAEFLHYDSKENCSDSIKKFIAQSLDMDVNVINDDMDFYSESLDTLLENTVKLDSKLRNKENRPSLLAMVVYSYKEDIDLDNWMTEYAKNNNTYFVDQTRNFLHMKKELNKYIEDRKIS